MTLIGWGAAGCVPDNHPLTGATSKVEIRVDTVREIYAADVLDENGNPVLPRQAPYEKAVQLFITNAGAADEGAYVDVQLNPPNTARLVPADDTCVQLAGAFRCTAAEDGFANFLIRSESDASGPVKIGMIGRTETETITVLQAGLPSDATNFQMIVSGVDSGTVKARFNALECTLSPEPDITFNKWPEGETRVREAEVRATAPTTAPGVIEHAPVIVESLHPEVFVTLDPSCPEPRTSRIRVQLDALGKSPKFYFCFSDVGGSQVQLAFSSGRLGAGTTNPSSLLVEAEPRLLRIVTKRSAATVGDGQLDFVSVSAFDADLKKVAFTVDLRVDEPSVLSLTQTAVLLPADKLEEKLVVGEPLAPGEVKIIVTPEFHDEPACASETITISETEF